MYVHSIIVVNALFECMMLIIDQGRQCPHLIAFSCYTQAKYQLMTIVPINSICITDWTLNHTVENLQSREMHSEY